MEFTSPGRYSLELPLIPPESFLLVIGMTDEHGQYFEVGYGIDYIVCCAVVVLPRYMCFLFVACALFHYCFCINGTNICFFAWTSTLSDGGSNGGGLIGHGTGKQHH
jgi:hypothetical protein